jgi:hypothetical protein
LTETIQYPDDYNQNDVDSRVNLRTKNIRNAIYGGDVRNAIAQGVEIGSTVSQEAKKQSQNIDDRFNDQISGSTNDNEVIDFRHSDMLSKSFTTAKLRGDFWDEEFRERAVNVKWFGAVGDGADHILSDSYETLADAQADYPSATALTDTKDLCAITQAISVAQSKNTNVYIPSGTYMVNRTIDLPTNAIRIGGAYETSVIKATSAFCSNSLSASKPVINADSSGQPIYYLGNLKIDSADNLNNNLIGFQLGASRASKISNLIVKGCQAHGTLIKATNSGALDIENPTFEHYWQIDSGSFRLETNPDINSGGAEGANITDAAFFDCQITSNTLGNNVQSQPAVEIVNTSDTKSIFGVAFQRCFLQAINNNLIYIKGADSYRDVVHDILFDFIKGELWGDSHEPGNGTSSDVTIHLENCINVSVTHSKYLGFDEAQYAEIVNCEAIDLDGAYLRGINDQKANLLSFDSKTQNCRAVLSDLHITEGDANHTDIIAIDYCDIFNKIVDNGFNNEIIGNGISKHLTLSNNPKLMTSFSNGVISSIDSSFHKGSTAVKNDDGSVTVTFTPDNSLSLYTFYLPVDDSLVGKMVGGYLKCKITGSSDDLAKFSFQLGGRGKNLKTDGEIHDYEFLGNIENISASSSRTAYVVGVKGEGTISEKVTCQIYVLESYTTPEIPYIGKYEALNIQ